MDLGFCYLPWRRLRTTGSKEYGLLCVDLHISKVAKFQTMALEQGCTRQCSSCENTYGGGTRIAIIFGRKQSKEKKKDIASTNVRFSAQIQVKSKKKAFHTEIKKEG